MAIPIICLIVLIWPSLSEADKCSHLPGYKGYGKSCFKFTNVKKTWAAAEAACVADGGQLASIHSSEEQAFVAKLVPSDDGPWIGLMGTAPELTWSDGTGVDYTNWFGQEPNNNKVICAKIKSLHAHTWVEKFCSLKYSYICRIEDHTQARFIRVADGVKTDPAVSPSSSHTVRSRVECAWRCQQHSDCKLCIITEDKGKYLCETYTTLYPASTPASPISRNYQKTYP